MEAPVLESLFNKAAGLQVCNFIKNRLQHRYFLVIIAKFLRISVKSCFCLFKRSIEIYKLCHKKHTSREVYKEKSNLQKSISFVTENLELLKK